MTSKEMEFLKNAEKEAYQEQKKELDRIFPVLSLSSRAEIVSLAQKLKTDEEEAMLRKKFLYAFNKLNKKGQALVLAYVETLAANPKYRK